MIFTREQLIAVLAGEGVPVVRAYLAPDEISGNLFATVSREWVTRTWEETVAELASTDRRLVEQRDIGGGKTIIVPRYLLNGFCCRGHGLKVYANGLMGFALQAALATAPLDHDALAWGFLHYVATPRAENGNRNGPHERLWGIDHEGHFFSFEAQDCTDAPLTKEELESITLVFAQ